VRVESVYRRRPGLVTAAFAQVESWLLEPLPDRVAALPPPELGSRSVVAVVGVAPGCGTSTVARALAARLAAADPGGAALVAGAGAPPPFAPAVRAASRLRVRLGLSGGDAWAAGRLCLSRPPDLPGLVAAASSHAPVVLDAGADAVMLAGALVVVAPPQAEPALAALLAQSLGGPGYQPLVVVNRAVRPGRWAGRAALGLPDSHAGARLAAAGWEARGALGRAIAELAALCG
jgi:hypothetical protein